MRTSLLLLCVLLPALISNGATSNEIPNGAAATESAAPQPPTSDNIAEPIHTTDPRYRFLKTISRPVLNNYLSRAVTHYGLCSTSPEPATTYFDDDLRMLTGLGAKFIGRVAYAWVPPDDDETHFRLATERAAAVHKADPEIILQAAVFEAVYESVGRIPVPDWVFTEFKLPLQKHTFRYEAMLYDGNKFRNHWTAGASVPDMSKIETRMYFYYRWNWGYDCGSWFAHQPQQYRAEYMAYARKWLLDRHEDAWLQMPTLLNLAIPVDGHRMWQGNMRSAACPEGYDSETAIKAIWQQEKR